MQKSFYYFYHYYLPVCAFVVSNFYQIYRKVKVCIAFLRKKPLQNSLKQTNVLFGFSAAKNRHHIGNVIDFYMEEVHKKHLASFLPTQIIHGQDRFCLTLMFIMSYLLQLAQYPVKAINLPGNPKICLSLYCFYPCLSSTHCEKKMAASNTG